MTFSPNDFIHPEDKAAREQLESIPGFSAAVKVFLRAGLEQYFHGTNMAQKIRLGPDQLPEIYELLPPICRRLNIEEPEFYLQMGPQPNAYTSGETRAFVTVNSGIVDLLDRDELAAVIAHECGHIVCQHVLYNTMALLLIEGGMRLFGPLRMLSRPIVLGLQYWSRRKELSADRAGAVALGDAEPMIRTFVRLSGGGKHLTQGVDLQRYMEQAEAYDKLLDTTWDKVLQGFATMDQSHPFPAVRARELSMWSQTPTFQRLMEAAELHSASVKCDACGRTMTGSWKFCPGCGRAIEQSALLEATA